MIPSLQQTYDLGSTQAVRHRVLRNTYWLLALSMIPTVLGAFIGVSLQLPMLSGGMGFIVFMAVAFGFIFAIEKTKDSAVGVAVLLGFTFFMASASDCWSLAPESSGAFSVMLYCFCSRSHSSMAMKTPVILPLSSERYLTSISGVVSVREWR